MSVIFSSNTPKYTQPSTSPINLASSGQTCLILLRMLVLTRFRAFSGCQKIPSCPFLDNTTTFFRENHYSGFYHCCGYSSYKLHINRIIMYCEQLLSYNIIICEYNLSIYLHVVYSFYLLCSISLYEYTTFLSILLLIAITVVSNLWVITNSADMGFPKWPSQHHLTAKLF